MKYKGVKINLGGQIYLVPSLSAGQAREFDDAIAEINRKAMDPTSTGGLHLIAEWVPVILSAVQRNYPDVTAEQLLDWVDLNNFSEIRQAVLGQSKDAVVLGE